MPPGIVNSLQEFVIGATAERSYTFLRVLMTLGNLMKFWNNYVGVSENSALKVAILHNMVYPIFKPHLFGQTELPPRNPF